MIIPVADAGSNTDVNTTPDLFFFDEVVTLRNAMKKLGHKVTDLRVNEDKFTNEDSYILVDSNDQIMMDIGQKVDGKSIRKVKVKKED